MYLRADTSWYQPGDIVLNSADGKYYRRKQAGQTQAEQTGTITFDYSAWTMISQPRQENTVIEFKGMMISILHSLQWNGIKFQVKKHLAQKVTEKI